MLNKWTYSGDIIKEKDRIIGEALNEAQAARIVFLHNEKIDDFSEKIGDFSDKIDVLSNEMKELL